MTYRCPGALAPTAPFSLHCLTYSTTSPFFPRFACLNVKKNIQEYFQNLLNSFTSLIKSSGAAAKVFEFIDRKPCYRSEDPRFAIAPADSPAVAPEDEAPPVFLDFDQQLSEGLWP